MSFVTVVSISCKKAKHTSIVTTHGVAGYMGLSENIATFNMRHELAMLTYSTPHYEVLKRLVDSGADLDTYIHTFNRIEGFHIHRYGYTLPFDV